ncbi:MAG TPA: Clp protease N-terminal domain-containing protein [Solirubrobacteraceae bacterium]|nr:Clp protease N-terminal domain-containing protein [Solirubrobacteraceae bacterium]
MLVADRLVGRVCLAALQRAGEVRAPRRAAELERGGKHGVRRLGQRQPHGLDGVAPRVRRSRPRAARCASDSATKRARSSSSLSARRALSHGFVGTEHILLGLLAHEPGLAARVLNSLGLSIARVPATTSCRWTGPVSRAALRRSCLHTGQEGARACVARALSVGESHIRTDHVLLALVGESSGVAAHPAGLRRGRRDGPR